jgi:hypothetical protein
MRIRPIFVFAWVLVAIIFAAVAFAFHIRHPRIVASAIAPDGTELRVVQTCNWSPEPFTTAVYYRRPGGRWGWFYYDHQDDYWGSGHTELNAREQRIRIYRGERLTATFDYISERFVLLREGCPARESIGAQGWTSPPL